MANSWQYLLNTNVLLCVEYNIGTQVLGMHDEVDVNTFANPKVRRIGNVMGLKTNR